MTREEQILSLRETVAINVRLQYKALHHHPVLDSDDLTQAAWIGAIKTVDRFDSSRGTQLKTLGNRKIKGEIIEELRRNDHLTRYQRDQIKHGDFTRPILFSMDTPETMTIVESERWHQYLLFICVLFGMLRPALAQNRYVAAHSASLSSQTDAVTVQQPATGAKTVSFEGAWVYCSAACTFTLSVNGTAASATTLTPAALPPTTASPAATAWSGSNVGAGTQIGISYQVAAGATYPISLANIRMGPTGTATNLTIAIASVTATTGISIQWTEQ